MRRGFSLLEILIALTILAIALGSVIQLFYVASRSTTFDRNRNEALSNLKLLGTAIESGGYITPATVEPYYSDPQKVVTGPNTYEALDAPPFDNLEFVNPDRFERSIQAVPVTGFEGYLVDVIITIRWRGTDGVMHRQSLTVCVSRI